ncbi:nucleotidyltransferase domain-containing protein [Arthrobacter sp. zg-Y1110]|uniref:nucleotidyltransferase domain-containing protein n=1 Tax=Arthrobacter sp. zg-Y1110 TaxID=2886932 RepID=UPI001D144480|nr:hypothetical protein [Arthrobacter sp. zg-Y1110]MCC3291383.1 hypothetical protein [Arthrobacter sp. zg-Y1110]UWX83801.1 hypothetical protein N2K99_09770 [Arthrobacter sp. zg-Y1110]
MDELVQAQLSAITEVLRAANTLGIEVWLRGGWAMDFYLGQVTRNHEDVDWFVWQDDLPVISGLLVSRVWLISRTTHATSSVTLFGMRSSLALHHWLEAIAVR